MTDDDAVRAYMWIKYALWNFPEWAWGEDSVQAHTDLAPLMESLQDRIPIDEYHRLCGVEACA